MIAVRDAAFQTTYLPGKDGKSHPLRPPRTPLLPGPETEVDRIKARLAREAQVEIVALFAPTHAHSFQ